MYNMKQIEQLAQTYVKTEDTEVFKLLMGKLRFVIKMQLGKNYGSLYEYWEDLEQEVLLKLYKNRKSLLTTTSTRLFRCLYNRIRDYLRTAVKSGRVTRI